MPKRSIKREFYDNLVNAFRESPGVAAHAARQAGCDARTARRAWDKGWTPGIPWARSIKLVLEDEQEAARTLQRRIEEDKHLRAQDDRDKARDDAVSALAQEGQMLKLARTNVIAGMASVALMLPTLRRIGEEVKRQFETGEIDARLGMRMLKEFSYMLRNFTMAMQSIIEGERQSKGEPTAIIGLQLDGNLSIDEALREMSEVSELYELAKRRGLVDGNGAPTSEEMTAAEPKPPNGGQVH